MPETDQQAAQEPATDPDADQQSSATDDAEVDWKAKAREWERRAKDNHKLVQQLQPKAQQFDALEEASRTDLERAQAQADALQQELATTQRQALIASVALDKGLPPSLARRLQGDSKEDLEADAEDLLAQFPQQSNEPRAPRVDLSQGSSGKGSVSADPAQQFASIIRGQLGS